MKQFLLSIALLSTSTLFAADVYNASNGQLTIPSVNVGGTNYNNVVINVGGVVKIGGTGGFALQNFAKNLYSKPRTFILSAQDSASPPNKYGMTVTYTPGPDATFESQSVNVVNMTVSITLNGAPFGSFSNQAFFSKGNFNKHVGDNGFGSYTIYTDPSIATNNTNIGDFSFVNSSISYKDSTKKGINNYSVHYSSLEASSDGSSAYACNLQTNFDPTDISGSVQSEKQCLQVDNSGAFVGGAISVLNINNTVLYFTGTFQ